MPGPWCSRWPSCRPMRRPMPRCWKTSPTGATASRRWSAWMRRTGCCWTSPAPPICSAAKRRCWRQVTGAIAEQGFAVRGAIAGTSLAAHALARFAPRHHRVPPGGEAAGHGAAAHHRAGMRRQNLARPAPCRAQDHRHGGGALAQRIVGAIGQGFCHTAEGDAGGGRTTTAPRRAPARPDGRAAFRRTHRHRRRVSPPPCSAWRKA